MVQLFALLETLDHLLERTRQLAGLITRDHGHPNGQVAVRDAGCRFAQGIDRDHDRGCQHHEHHDPEIANVQRRARRQSPATATAVMIAIAGTVATTSERNARAVVDREEQLRNRIQLPHHRQRGKHRKRVPGRPSTAVATPAHRTLPRIRNAVFSLPWKNSCGSAAGARHAASDESGPWLTPIHLRSEPVV
jgi:hypothetical protein